MRKLEEKKKEQKTKTFNPAGKISFMLSAVN